MKDKKDSLISLNDKLNTEFDIQKLEKRLETDPLLLGGTDGLLNVSSADCFTCNLNICFNCGEF